jgi:hypothetical protein
MYWRIDHEVMPSELALSCQHCHVSLQGRRTCDRCHLDDRNVDFAALSRQGIDFKVLLEQGRDVTNLIGQTNYIDFVKLGYRGDPIVYGGRFERLPLRYQKPQ